MTQRSLGTGPSWKVGQLNLVLDKGRAQGADECSVPSFCLAIETPHLLSPPLLFFKGKCQRKGLQMEPALELAFKNPAASR